MRKIWESIKYFVTGLLYIIVFHGPIGWCIDLYIQKKQFRYLMKHPGELDTWQYTQVANILKEGGPRAAEVMKIIKEERPNYKEPPGRWR
jgi:hypothetical protein